MMIWKLKTCIKFAVLIVLSAFIYIMPAFADVIGCDADGIVCLNDDLEIYSNEFRTLDLDFDGKYELYYTDTSGEGILGDMGSDYGDCLNYVAVPRCTYTGDGDHDCHAGEDIEGEVDSMGNQKVRLGCGGYYKCKGHDHWNCPGHFYVCCMGHTDITVNVKIMYIDEMINVIKNGYNVGLEDETESGE